MTDDPMTDRSAGPVGQQQQRQIQKAMQWQQAASTPDISPEEHDQLQRLYDAIHGKSPLTGRMKWMK